LDYSSDFQEIESSGPTPSSEFEDAFKNLLASITKMPSSERNSKIRKVLTNNYHQDLAEFVSIVLLDGENQETMPMKTEPSKEHVALDNLEAVSPEQFLNFQNGESDFFASLSSLLSPMEFNVL